MQLGTQNNPASQSDVPVPQGVDARSASSSEATGTSLLPFEPTYDADGNMTTVQTSTGTWTVEYNGENRPVTWTKSSGEKIYMMYDAQGRRVEKRVLNAAGVRTLRERYVYVGYTCVQVLNGDDGNAVVKEFAWDPTEPVATRPLMFKYVPNGVTLFYAFDGNKNVSDVFSWAVRNGVPAHYDYAPFGAITRTAKNTPFTLDLLSLNPWRFSSEFYDSELDLVYYNYRHYSPLLGRFLSRDPIEEQGGLNLYGFCGNCCFCFADLLGLGFSKELCRKLMESIQNRTKSLIKELNKYDPVEDGKGGFPYKYGTTKPGGHYKEIKNLQRGLKNELAKWKDVCKDDDNDPPCSPPYPVWADQLSNEYVPEPVYANNFGSDSLWEAVIVGAGAGAVAAIIAGQAGPQIFFPEEIVTVPASALIGGIIGIIYWGD